MILAFGTCRSLLHSSHLDFRTVDILCPLLDFSIRGCTTAMSTESFRSSRLLSIPFELRNLIYLEIARIYILNISARDRRITLADKCIDNACCAMHSKTTVSTATSLALVSHQIAFEARQVAFHHPKSPVSIYFSSISTLSDFERLSALYQPKALRDFCLFSAQAVLIKAPSAWQALPLPSGCFGALGRVEITGIAKLLDSDVLRLSLPWNGWQKDEEWSNNESWTFLRVQ